MFPKSNNKSHYESQLENWKQTVKNFLIKEGFKGNLEDIRKYYTMHPTLYTKQEWTTESNHLLKTLSKVKLNAANKTSLVVGKYANTLKQALKNEEVLDNFDKLLDHYKKNLMGELKSSQYSWPFEAPVAEMFSVSDAAVSIVYFVFILTFGFL